MKPSLTLETLQYSLRRLAARLESSPNLHVLCTSEVSSLLQDLANGCDGDGVADAVESPQLVLEDVIDYSVH